MNSKMLQEQMNGVFSVQFVTTKVTATPKPIYNCQVVARHEYHTDSLDISTPGILVVQPLRNCITLLNMQAESISDKYIYPKSTDKVDYTKADKTHYNRGVFTPDRIDLLTEMAEVVLDKLIKNVRWDRPTWDSRARLELVEPLFTITEEGLDEMIKRNLTLIDTRKYA